MASGMLWRTETSSTHSLTQYK